MFNKQGLFNGGCFFFDGPMGRDFPGKKSLILTISFVRDDEHFHRRHIRRIDRVQRTKFKSMGTLQRVVKLNQLSSENPGLIDGVSSIISIQMKISLSKIMYGIIIGKVEMRTFEGST